MGICLSLEEVDKLYKYFFTKQRPIYMPYTDAVRVLVTDVGYDRVSQQLKEVSN